MQVDHHFLRGGKVLILLLEESEHHLRTLRRGRKRERPMSPHQTEMLLLPLIQSFWVLSPYKRTAKSPKQAIIELERHRDSSHNRPKIRMARIQKVIAFAKHHDQAYPKDSSPRSLKPPIAQNVRRLISKHGPKLVVC